MNLTTPSGGQTVSHTDIPEFRGVDRHNAESWFLQAMDASGLFEEERITSITAVVGDNDFMHHKVERTGAPGVKAPARLSIDSTLAFVAGECVRRIFER